MSPDPILHRDHALGHLVARLARGIILATLVALLLRQILLPHYGISAEPNNAGNWFFLLIASNLFMPWSRWATQPRRLQWALCGYGVLTFSMYLYVSWNIGLLGWWLLPLMTLWSALVIFALELGVQQSSGAARAQAMTGWRLDLRHGMAGFDGRQHLSQLVRSRGGAS